MYKLITELYNVSCKIDGNMDSSYEPSVHVEDLSGSDSSKDSLPMCIYFYLFLWEKILLTWVRHLEKEVLLNSQESKFPDP